MDVICIENLTKDYGSDKGVFNVSMRIPAGEVYGFLGPNGAGKSTTMRHLMGFMKPNSGTAEIVGLDCWKEQKAIQKIVGYIPGEISLPNDMTGKAYLKLIANMRRLKDLSRQKELLEIMELDPDYDLKRMSKGMKQKVGIVAAMMHSPEILLLDEPSSGLDPLMQNRFIQLIEREKEKGTTILMSSHMFEEVERTCDRIGIIKDGKIIREVRGTELKESRIKTFRAEFADTDDMNKFPNSQRVEEPNQILIQVANDGTNAFIKALSECSLLSLSEEKHTLEEYFTQFYKG